MIELGNFIKFLEENNLVNFTKLEDNEEGFITRFKIQKYVYLAKQLKLDVIYDHGMYLYGPYSRTLAKDYYDLARNPKNYKKSNNMQLGKFDEKKFLTMVKSKDIGWLEISTTMISLNRLFKNKNKLIENIKSLKGNFDEKFMATVLDDLKKLKMVKLDA